MDTNGDGKVSSLDSTFNDRTKIIEACVALTDYLDLLLCTGSLKSEYSSGFIGDTVRADNPRDIFIQTIANYATYWDDNDNDEDQAKLINGRLKQAAYLIATSPQAIIQK